MRTMIPMLLLLLFASPSLVAQTPTPACSTTSEEGNAAPTANDDYLPWPAGPVLIPVLANDTDVDGDPLVLIEPLTVNGGSAVITDAGATITFTPGAGSVSGQVQYRISDGQGNTSAATAYLTANAGADFSAVCDGTFCTLTAQPFNPAGFRAYVWNFGDNTALVQTSSTTTTHQYAALPPNATLTREVTLTVDYTSGARAVVAKIITLIGPARQVTWTHRNTFQGCNQCLTVQSWITASNLPRTQTEEWRYFMDWGDGTPRAQFPWDANASTYPAGILTHTYATSGQKRLTLTAERWVFFSGHGWIRVEEPQEFGGRWVEIVNQPPVVQFTATASANDSKTYTFHPQGSWDDNGLSEATHQLTWDFGDGTYAAGTVVNGDPQPVNHSYRTTGTHLARLTIQDFVGGHVTTVERPVTIANEPPVAVIWHGCAAALGTCMFTGLGSRDENDAIVSYDWRITGNGVNASATGRTVSNWPFAPGCYDVELTVTDEGGATHTSARTIAVSSQPLAQGDVVVADAHSSAYEWTTSPYGPIMRATLGNLNGILEPGERVNVEPMVRTTPSPNLRTLLVNGIQSTNANVGVVVENHVPSFDQSAGVTDCWRVAGAEFMKCMVLGASIQGTRSTPHADFRWSMPRVEGGAELVDLTLHVGASFSDVPVTAWYYRDVEAILHAGLTSGCGGTSFCPDVVMPRDQLMVWLLRAKRGAAYVPPVCAGQPFGDVTCGTTPFADWIAQAKLDGIVTGYGDNTFRPQQPVTRADAAVTIVRTVLDGRALPPCTQDFTDVPCTGNPSTSHWAADFVSELKRLGGTGGCGNGLYCPDTHVTRGEAAAFFTKVWKLGIAHNVCPAGMPILNGAMGVEER